jgi:hypothetical protein
LSEVLYAVDEAMVFFPREWCETASKARYRGWKEMHEVGMCDPFWPADWRVLRRYAFQVRDDPFAEVTHRLTRDPMTPGAYPVWVVEEA